MRGKDDSDNLIAAVVLAVLGFLALIPAAIILDGWVLSVLWCWFMVPTLGLPALTVAQAIGIAIVVSLVAHRVQPKSEKERPLWEALTYLFAKPLMALLVGWIVKGFLP